MRELNESEKQIVQELVKVREDVDLRGFCAAKILDESLDSIAVEWKDGKVSVFAPKNINAMEQFMYLCDIISLFQYLEKEGMIMLHRNPELLQEKALYNKKMYKKRGNVYYNKENEEVNFQGKPLVLTYSLNKQHSFEMVTDLVSLLDKYACAFIHPTQELVDYVNHGFKTKEDIKYLITTIIAIIAILGGMFKEELKVLWDWIWQLVEWMF